jgi:hypothetical protein
MIPRIAQKCSYSYSYSMKWYSYSKGAPETPAINVGRSRPVDRYSAIVTVRSLQCDRYSAIVTLRSLRWFLCGGLLRRARQKNYSINARKIGINNAQGCCFNLSRHKAFESVVDDLKLSRLGSYNHWGFPFVCHFQDSMHLYESHRNI